jgi:Ca2+-binding RTX toxin-like protein
MADIAGTAGSETLANPFGSDVLRGLGGNNVLTGGSDIGVLLGGRIFIDDVLLTDDDVLDGGAGVDTVSYASQPLDHIMLTGDTIEIRHTRIAQPIGSFSISTGSYVQIDDTYVLLGQVTFDPPGWFMVSGRLRSGDPTPIERLEIIAGTGFISHTDPDFVHERLPMTGVRVSLLLQGGPQDTLGAGIDTLVGIENLTGSRLADELTGDGGNNILRGLDGNDILEGGLGSNLLDGGAGFDLASYAGAAAGVTVHLGKAGASGGAGIDHMISIEGLLGSGFADTLAGDAGANRLLGGDGNDRLFGAAGDDTLAGGNGDDLLNGGDGIDTADFSAATGPVRALLGTGGSVNTISQGRDTFASIENLVGGAFNDILGGDGGDNRIEGGGGNDTITGGAGADTLLGGDGNDSITGGLGADTIDAGAGFDTIRYGSAADSRLAATDVISGFVAQGEGKDRIGFEADANALFAGVAPAALSFARLEIQTEQIFFPPVPPTDDGNYWPVGGWLTLSPALMHGVAPASSDDSAVAPPAAVPDPPFPLDVLLAQAPLAASTATTLAVTQLDFFGLLTWRSVLVVNDTDAAFDAATDMVIELTGSPPGPLSASNFFLF